MVCQSTASRLVQVPSVSYSRVSGVFRLSALFAVQSLDAHRVMPPNQPTATTLSTRLFSFSQSTPPSSSTSSSSGFLFACFRGESAPDGVEGIKSVFDTRRGRGAGVLAMPRVHGLLLTALLMRLGRARVRVSPAVSLSGGPSFSCGRL